MGGRAEDAAALAQLPVSAVKHPATDKGRPIERVQAPGVVARTFDDGPGPQWTPRILQILRQNHVPATFFVIGTEGQNYPALLRAEGGRGQRPRQPQLKLDDKFDVPERLDPRRQHRQRREVVEFESAFQVVNVSNVSLDEPSMPHAGKADPSAVANTDRHPWMGTL